MCNKSKPISGTSRYHYERKICLALPGTYFGIFQEVGAKQNCVIKCASILSGKMLMRKIDGVRSGSWKNLGEPLKCNSSLTPGKECGWKLSSRQHNPRTAHQGCEFLSQRWLSEESCLPGMGLAWYPYCT